MPLSIKTLESFWRVKGWPSPKLESMIMGMVLIGLCGGALWQGKRLSNFQTPWIKNPPEKIFKWPKEWAELIAFGHVSTLTDAIMLKAFQNPDYQQLQGQKHKALFYDLDLATELDPDFYELYLAGGSYLSVINGDIHGARKLLYRGVEQLRQGEKSWSASFKAQFWSQPWRLLVTLAYVELFDFNHLGKSVYYFRKAASYPSAPKFIRSIKRKTQTTEGMYDLGMRLILFLKEVYRDHASHLEKLKTQYLSLLVGRSLYLVNEKWDQYRGHKKNTGTSIAALWRRFQNQTHLSDPLGGRYYLTPQNKIKTTTRYQVTPGMPY